MWPTDPPARHDRTRQATTAGRPPCLIPSDEAFTALPLRALADAALARARALGAEHADFRFERVRSAFLAAAGRQARRIVGHHGPGVRGAGGARRDLGVRVGCGSDDGRGREGRVAGRGDGEALGPGDQQRVPTNVWSWRTSRCTPRTWISSYDIDPFSVPDEEKAGLLADWSARLLAADGVNHVDASLLTVHENKFYADTAGTVTTQQRVRLHPQLTAVAVDESSGEFDSMRTIAPPVGRGWEYLTGTGWDWESELARIPELLAEKMRAPSVQAGLYDLVVDPSNLWLTIHESIGHATELDRALGYEAAYAGTSFATFDQLGKLRYGSERMNVTGDRTAEHGLATIATTTRASRGSPGTS